MLTLSIPPAELPGLALARTHEAGLAAAHAVAVLPGLLPGLVLAAAHVLALGAFHALAVDEAHVPEGARAGAVERRLGAASAVPVVLGHLVRVPLQPDMKHDLLHFRQLPLRHLIGCAVAATHILCFGTLQTIPILESIEAGIHLGYEWPINFNLTLTQYIS